MSKTASELATEALSLYNGGNREDAVSCADRAIAMDPNEGKAYAVKGYVAYCKEKFQESVELLEKALSLGYKEPSVYEYLGFELTFKVRRREDAVKIFDTLIQISPKTIAALTNKGNALMSLGRIQEAKECFLAYIKTDAPVGPKTEALMSIGSLLQDEGKQQEALEYYNKGLELTPKDFRCRFFKAGLFYEQGKVDEAIAMYKSMLDDWPNSAPTNYQLASIYEKLGKTSEAQKCYEQGAKSSPVNSDQNRAKGQCLSKLGRHQEAMECFKKSKDLLENSSELYLPSFERGIKTALKAVLDSEEVANKVESEIAKLDQNSLAVQKFKTNIKLLQEKKVVVQNQAIDQAVKKGNENKDQQISELDQIKQEFERQLAALKKEMSEFKSEVKTEIKILKTNMDEMKEELNSKMDDFNKKLSIELDKQDLSPEDKTKIKAYFTAFIGTFSSAHVSAQVVDSGQVTLDSGSTSASILSFMASFTPFIGGALETGIKSIGDFLKSKEMITNARKLKSLAPDAVTLSQVIGKTGFSIATNKEKQQKIINVTGAELNKENGNVLKKIMKLCDEINEKIDALLYTQLYKTPAERMGHADANKLIEKWVDRSVTPYEIEDQFIELILNPEAGNVKEAAAKPVEGAPNGNRSSCCNLF